MKWIVLVGLLGMVGPLAMFLRSQPKYLVHACFSMGLLVFFLSPYLNISPISWRWPGAVKGLEVSVLDAIALSIIFATKRVRLPIGLIIGAAIYALGVFLSSFAAQQYQPVVFYAWQFVRTVLVCIAVAQATASDRKAAFALFAGLGLAMCIEAMIVARQYVGGNQQPGGSLGHRNSLGLTSHFAVMPAFALVLAGRRSLGAGLVVLAGAVVALAGGGRATIGLYAIGLMITMAMSMKFRMTGRKSAIAGLAVLGLLAATPVMMSAIERRSDAARASSDEERQDMKRAARMIIADYPLGIGAVQYALVANVGGYSSRAGVAWNASNRAAPVHNSYLLVTAELGFIGLIGMLTMLMTMVLVGLKAFTRLVPDEKSDLLIGYTSALIVVCLHLGYEWIFMTYYVHYLLAMNFGALIGLSAMLQRKVRPQAAHRHDAKSGALVPEAG